MHLKSSIKIHIIGGNFMIYKNMTNILNSKKIGDFEINKFSISKDDIAAILRGMAPGNYVRLMHKGTTVMSNSYMEKRTNESFVLNAHGNVLIAGLGIGLVLLAIQDKIDVQSITVIEKHKDVINLIAPQLPLNKKITIIHGDIFKWIPPEKALYDVIYFDIWDYINSDIWQDEMIPLKNKFNKYLKTSKESCMHCWAEHEASNNIRLV